MGHTAMRGEQARHGIGRRSAARPAPRHALRKPSIARTLGAVTDGPPVPRYRSIRSKLLFSFVAVILLPLLTLGVLGPSSPRAPSKTKPPAIPRSSSARSRATSSSTSGRPEASSPSSTPIPTCRRSCLGARPAGLSPATGRGRGSSCARSRPHPEIAGILLVIERNRPLSNEIQPITRDPLNEESWYRRRWTTRAPCSSSPGPSAGTSGAATNTAPTRSSPS